MKNISNNLIPEKKYFLQAGSLLGAGGGAGGRAGGAASEAGGEAGAAGIFMGGYFFKSSPILCKFVGKIAAKSGQITLYQRGSFQLEIY